MEFADKDFLTLDENTLIGEAAKAMYDRDACSIIVTSSDSASKARHAVGIITARDMLHRVIALNKGPFKVTLKQIMSTPLITIGEDTPVEDAISIMKSRNIARLPVVDQTGDVLAVASLMSLVGIVPGQSGVHGAIGA